MIHVRSLPRNPLARLAGGILALLAVAAVLVLGVFALAAFVVGGSLMWLYRALRAPARPAPAAAEAPPPGVIDGEFTVVSARPEPTRR
jgi:hypothetical protein